MEDEIFLHLIDDCAEYAESKMKMIKSLEDGYFQLALSRKSGIRPSLEDIRQEIIPSVTINFGIDSRQLVVMKQSKDVDQIDGALIMTGLPSKGLRRAQILFISALNEAVAQANIIQRVESSVSDKK